jgi:hypothetical protein
MDTSFTEETFQPSFYYYKGASLSKRRYYSIDGKKLDETKIPPSLLDKIKPYPPIYSFVDLKDNVRRKQLDLEELCAKVDLYKKVTEYFGDPSGFIDVDYNDTETIYKNLYYVKETKRKSSHLVICSYRFYISETHSLRLAQMGIVKKGGVKTEKIVPPRNIPIHHRETLEPFDPIRGEKFSQTNIFQKYWEKIRKLEFRIKYGTRSLHANAAKMEKSPYKNTSEADVIRVKTERDKLLHEYLDFIRTNPQPKKEAKPEPKVYAGNDLLVQLQITDKRSFWVWMKANHPDKHQGSPDIQNINAVFARALQAARAKGYI